MSSQQVNIFHTPSCIVSKFSRKQALVYVQPTIDECLKILPRQLGNHILSYTYALFDFYIENLVIKFGYKFVINTFLNLILCCTPTKLKLPKLTKINYHEALTIIMTYVKKIRVTRGRITSLFGLAIIGEESVEQQKQQQKLEDKISHEEFMRQITVGDIFHYNAWGYQNEMFLVCQKTNKTFYHIRVIITNETETNYTIKAHVVTRTYSTYNTTTMMATSTVTSTRCFITRNITNIYLSKHLLVKPKKKLIFQSQNDNLTPEFVLNKTEKRRSVMTLLRYQPVGTSKTEYQPMN
jgi:hypothetical protein